MELYNGILAVDIYDLTRADDGPAIMSKYIYIHLQQRGQISILRRGGGLDHGVLIEYASLPTRFKTAFVAKYGDPEVQRIQQMMEFKYDQAAHDWYYDEMRGVPSNLAERYTINASVLKMLSGKRARMQASRKTSGGSGMAWDAILEESERLRGICGHTLPRSMRLAELIRRFDAEGYGCLVSGKLGNDNSRTITEEMGQRILGLKRSVDPIYSIDMIWRQINVEAPSRGWRPLRSKSSITAFLQRTKAQWLDAEIGDTRAKMVLNRMHSTALPAVPNARWEGDGTKVNLYYRTYADGETRMASINVYEVVDIASEAMLGRAYGTRENFAMFYGALRNAAEKTGFLPYELVNDNQSSAKTAQAQEWLSRYAHVARTTAPHNGPSKTIESIFGRFQQQVLHQYWNFTGQNVTSRRSSSRPNMDRILKNVAALPDRPGVIAQYEAAVEQWNNSLHPDQARYPGLTRMQVYLSASCPDALRLADAARDTFWIKSEKPVMYTNAGFRFVVGGETYIMEVQDKDGYADLEWLDAHNGESFYYGYDPKDLSEIKLYSYNKTTGYRYVATAVHKPVIARDIWSQTERDSAYIREMERRVNEHRVRRDLRNKQLEIEQGVAPEQHGLVSSTPTGMSRTEYERIAARLDEAAFEEIPVPDAAGEEETVPTRIGQIQKRISGLDYEALMNM